ncbi:MAG TPA: fluoride efflux transporter CrcB [Chloroflexota bacterium]|jgi:CrcB protein
MTAQIFGATFLGGGAGAACRYGIGRLVGARYGGEFPLGTFLINVTGCFALGLLASLLARSHQDVALPTALLATGFLGGYTTFSTFALEGVVLFNDERRRHALLSLVATVVAGLLAAAAGAGTASLM